MVSGGFGWFVVLVVTVKCYTFDCFFRILVSMKMKFSQILAELQTNFFNLFFGSIVKTRD